MIAGRGFGKALALNTAIPTPSGWLLMRDLKIGDMVYDQSGHPCAVEATYEVPHPVDCYRVTFSDRTHIDACDAHLWMVYSGGGMEALNKGKTFRSYNGETFPTTGSVAGFRTSWPKQVRSSDNRPIMVHTEQMARMLRHGQRVFIPAAGPLRGTRPAPGRKSVPMDGWGFGYWLAAHRTGQPNLIHMRGDPENQASVVAGFKRARMMAQPVGRGRLALLGMGARAKEFGIGPSRAIPPVFLRAATSCRHSLLQGLMDARGAVERDGESVSFIHEDEALIASMNELICSLGQIVRQTCTGARFKLTWRPTTDPFLMRENMAGLRQRTAMPTDCMREVISVRKIPVQPMRCITVDSEHSMYLAGRQMVPTHNTRAVCEEVLWQSGFKEKAVSEEDAFRCAFVAPTFSDLRKISFEGASGLLGIIGNDESIYWRGSRSLAYNRNNQELRLWNGALIAGFSAEEPDRLRGNQFHFAGCEEVASYRHEEAMDQVLICLRLGDKPRLVIATTPRPTRLIRKIVEDAKIKPDFVRVVRGTSYENEALSKQYLAKIAARYEGTRLGRQELMAEVLGDTPGALWTGEMIEMARIHVARDQRTGALMPPNLPDFLRVVVAIDPMAGEPDAEERPGLGSETGIIVAALGTDEIAYVIEDCSLAALPAEWGRVAVDAYRRHNADKIIAETNQGGEMVKQTIVSVAGSGAVNYRGVHAKHGKVTRAEPVSALYAQGRVRHVGLFPALEDQLTTYVPGNKSPDRLDALVYAITDLLIMRQVIPTTMHDEEEPSKFDFSNQDDDYNDYGLY